MSFRRIYTLGSEERKDEIIMANDVVLYNAKDLQTIFKCGQKKAYQIMNMRGFPSFRIDSLLYVEKEELIKWLARNKCKNLDT